MKKKRLWSVILAAYVLFVFSNSMTPAPVSSAESAQVLDISRRLLETLGASALWLTEHFIRKTAHFIEYMVFGILLLTCLGTYEIPAERRWWIAAAAGIFIPLADETLQLFTMGRSGQISDVWLDCAGAAAGAAVFQLAARICRFRREKVRGKKL